MYLDSHDKDLVFQALDHCYDKLITQREARHNKMFFWIGSSRNLLMIFAVAVMSVTLFCKIALPDYMYWLLALCFIAWVVFADYSIRRSFTAIQAIPGKKQVRAKAKRLIEDLPNLDMDELIIMRRLLNAVIQNREKRVYGYWNRARDLPNLKDWKMLGHIWRAFKKPPQKARI